MRRMMLVAASRFVWWCESKWQREHRLDGVGTPEWEQYKKCFLMLMGEIAISTVSDVVVATADVATADDVSDVVEYIVNLMMTADPIEFAECYRDKDEALAEVAEALDVAPWTLINMLDDMASTNASARGVMDEYDAIVFPHDTADDVVNYLADLLVELPKRFIRGLLDSSPWKLVEMLADMGNDGSAMPIVANYNRLTAVA